MDLPQSVNTLTDSDSEIATEGPKRPTAKTAAVKKPKATGENQAKAKATPKKAKPPTTDDATPKHSTKKAAKSQAKDAAISRPSKKNAAKLETGNDANLKPKLEAKPKRHPKKRPAATDEEPSEDTPANATKTKRPSAVTEDDIDHDEAADDDGGQPTDNAVDDADGDDDDPFGNYAEPRDPRLNRYGTTGRYALVPYRTRGGCAVKDYTTGKQLSRTYVACLAVVGDQ